MGQEHLIQYFYDLLSTTLVHFVYDASLHDQILMVLSPAQASISWEPLQGLGLQESANNCPSSFVSPWSFKRSVFTSSILDILAHLR